MGEAKRRGSFEQRKSEAIEARAKGQFRKGDKFEFICSSPKCTAKYHLRCTRNGSYSLTNLYCKNCGAKLRRIK